VQLIVFSKTVVQAQNAQLWLQRLSAPHQVPSLCTADLDCDSQQQTDTVVLPQMTAAMAIFAMLLVCAVYQSSPLATAMQQVLLSCFVWTPFQTGQTA
jgi:hypothetical protein